MDSPCHYCPKCPCKEHDTCKEFIDYRAEMNNISAKRVKEGLITDYACRSFERVNKKKWRSNRK